MVHVVTVAEPKQTSELEDALNCVYGTPAKLNVNPMGSKPEARSSMPEPKIVVALVIGSHATVGLVLKIYDDAGCAHAFENTNSITTSEKIFFIIIIEREKRKNVGVKLLQMKL